MYWSRLKEDDEYNTPRELWDNITDYLPSKDKVVWEAFYGNGKSGQILSELGCTVIQSNVDFFDDNSHIIEKSDMIISNVPFSKKKEILARLKEIDKPFILIMPASTMFTNYLRDTFEKNEIQIMIPKKRMHFEKNGVVLKRTSFDCCYFCYKMNLKNDIIWL
jgi:hypothetical protein